MLTCWHEPVFPSHLLQTPWNTSVQPSLESVLPAFVRITSPNCFWVPSGTCFRHSFWRPGPARSDSDLATAPWLRSKSWATVLTITSTYTHCIPMHTYSVSQKKIPPAVFRHFFTNCWAFLINFCTHELCVHIYARLQILIQLSPTLTKLCHIKWEHPSNFFYISLELNF